MKETLMTNDTFNRFVKMFNGGWVDDGDILEIVHNLCLCNAQLISQNAELNKSSSMKAVIKGEYEK